MKTMRFPFLLVLMVVVPTGALALLGVRLVRDGEALVARQATEATVTALDALGAGLAAGLAARGADLVADLADLPVTPDGVRAHRAGHPALGRVLVVERQGGRLFPPADAPVSEDEAALVERTRGLVEGGVLPTLAAGSRAGEGQAPDHGWHGFFHGDGLHLLLWRAEPDRIVATELTPVRLLALLVDALPDQETATERPRTALLDAQGRTVYAWGGAEPPRGAPPVATVPLAAPLGALRLARWAAPGEAATGIARGLAYSVALGVGAVALVLVGLAVYLARERRREQRLTLQRVGFVGQVSHELKTPLTNIRLYAELLREDLDPEDETEVRRARQLGVIIEESERLARLVANVLTFARGEDGRLAVRRRAAVVDDVVRRTVEALSPSLAQAGVAPTLDLAAGAPVSLDPDAVEQILANLLGNVAKYAPGSGGVRITSRQADGRTVVTVADAGPGVPAAHRERIFEPFHRVSDRLTDGVAGTGIGLDIARRLARLHGGELRLVASTHGATFALELATPEHRGGDPS